MANNLVAPVIILGGFSLFALSEALTVVAVAAILIGLAVGVVQWFY